MLRETRPEDSDRLLQLIGRYFEHDHIAFDEERVRRGLAQLLTEPHHGHAWILEVDNQVAGYAIVTFGFDLEMGGRFALLTDLYLDPEYRHRGLGMKAVGEIERRLIGLGIVEFELTVERGNTQAQALYKKAGFTARDRFPMNKRIA